MYIGSHSTSSFVFYASKVGAKLDSNVIEGGGTDDTKVLQSILDKATELGNLHLIMDGAALVHGLVVHSNTTIECMNKSCGFYLASQSNCSILANANPSEKERKDRNITIIGGTYNHNCLNQKHHIELKPGEYGNRTTHWVTTIEFFGVENLLIRDVTIRNQRTLAMHITNWYKVHMDNITIELPDKIQEGHQDGIHFQGPGQFLTMKNIQGCAWDDFIALNADDGLWAEHSSTGDITDVLIDGVNVDDTSQVIRLLSITSRIDRVIIRNITGTYRSFGFWISPFALEFFDYGMLVHCPGKKRAVDPGNYGNIIFDTVDLRQSAPNYTHTPPFLFRLGGRHECLTLRNIYSHRPTDNRPIVEIEGPDKNIADIGSLILDNVHIYHEKEGLIEANYFIVKGKVNNFIINNLDITAPFKQPEKCTIVQTRSASAYIDSLLVNNARSNINNCLISHTEGFIGQIEAGNICCTQKAESLIELGGGTVGSVNVHCITGYENKILRKT